jgi:hypothetical protein
MCLDLSNVPIGPGHERCSCSTQYYYQSQIIFINHQWGTTDLHGVSKMAESSVVRVIDFVMTRTSDDQSSKS